MLVFHVKHIQGFQAKMCLHIFIWKPQGVGLWRSQRPNICKMLVSCPNNLVYIDKKKREPTSVPSHFFKISVNNFLINVNFVWIFKTGLAAEHEVGSGLMV